MGPFLFRRLGMTNSKDGPWNPEKALPVPALLERYDKKEGLLTTKSRTEAIGKYHHRISYYSLVPRTCELFGFSRSVARINADQCCFITFIYFCLHMTNLGKLNVDF